VQTAVEADLGLSVLSPLSLAEGIAIADENSGLPKLPTADLAIYSRRTPNHPMVQRLIAFLVESLAAWKPIIGVLGRIAASPLILTSTRDSCPDSVINLDSESF